MADIRHRVGIYASQAKVYEAVATIKGLSGWWTPDVQGNADAGGKLEFLFGSAEPYTVMEVTELTPNQHVGWRCVSGPDEWVGTRLTFDLKPSTTEGETVLLFSQANWREPVEFMYHCSTKWGYFLQEIKSWLEGGEVHPHPNDKKISSWD